MTDQDIINALIEREGDEYTDDPADGGGPTKFGITRATLSEWRGAQATAEDVKKLERPEAEAIYRARYIQTPHFDAIASMELRAAVVDAGVNSGPSAAVRMLQRALGMNAIDGVLGSITLTLANAHDGRKLAVKLCAQRVRFLGRLITDNPTQAKFAAGWMARVASIVEDLA